MTKLLVYAWAYIYVVLGLLDLFGDWLQDQVDHNDYLAGGLIVTSFMIVSWMLGALQIVWMGGK